MILKNRKKYSLEFVLAFLDSGFNLFLSSNGSAKIFQYKIDEYNRLLIVNMEKLEVEICITTVDISKIELVKFNDKDGETLNYLERFLERLYITGDLFNNF